MSKTGLQYLFIVTTINGTGQQQITKWSIVAIDTAHAWEELGKEIQAFMYGPNGRKVIAVQLVAN